MYLAYLVILVILALRIYLNIYALNRDTKSLLNLISTAIICVSSFYFFAGLILADAFFRDTDYLNRYVYVIGLCFLFIDSLFSVVQVVRVFVFKFGIRVRIYRILSLAMIFLTANAGVAMLFTLSPK